MVGADAEDPGVRRGAVDDDHPRDVTLPRGGKGLGKRRAGRDHREQRFRERGDAGLLVDARERLGRHRAEVAVTFEDGQYGHRPVCEQLEGRSHRLVGAHRATVTGYEVTNGLSLASGDVHAMMSISQ